ncbi:MAG: hypothetical protein D6753_11020 [Planctomycetota bacterium]|nr:MAG: hypothetical protein D6753_11020 [Planctomycetota bacterium]
MTQHSKNDLTPFRLSDRIMCVPVVHGSGNCALAIRQWLLNHPCDCLVVPLPESFRHQVLAGVDDLPRPSIVLQPPQPDYQSFAEQPWAPDQSDESVGDATIPCSYVPLDPCQPVITALRVALGEHWRIEFADLETNHFRPIAAAMPDAYALRTVSLERFATAILPSVPRPFDTQVTQRLQYMANRLRGLEQEHRHVVALCSILEWPWLREAYQRPADAVPEHDSVSETQRWDVHPNSLAFLFGELPFITGLYEQARQRLEEDADLAIDGVKQLLLSARSSYLQDLGKRARRITPLLLKQCLKYIRNLTLIEHRMTPDLYTMAIAAQQILGDQFAIHLVETARNYPFGDPFSDMPMVTMGIDQARLPDGDVVDVVSRLPGPPRVWRSLQLRKRPTKEQQQEWSRQWNPFTQCSWPPEDELIESFRTRVTERARALIGADLARTEKFTTSIKDGIDIRETLRHWYDGDIYVKVLPPSVGTIDCTVMLFDVPADPQDYPWRVTWYAEHANESTMAFYATDFRQEVIGPGIALATYGGAMFLFPPRAIPNVWEDPRLEMFQGLEERLVGAACLHARENHIALLSPCAPGAALRRIARTFRKRLVHLPSGSFNDAMIQQLRMVHVLNGKHVRSYADHFIRRA